MAKVGTTATQNPKTDCQLLSEYALNGAEEAFSAIVERHSAFVCKVCMRILGDPHAAEDASQATFLVLMQKARTLPRTTALLGWLYVAAQLSAKQMRRTLVRQAKREREVAAMCIDSEKTPIEGVALNDVRQNLDELLVSLPAPQRTAIVLCYLNGSSYAEAAEEMNCPVKTLHSRLTHGVAKLRRKLERKGIPLSAVMLATLLKEQTQAAVPVNNLSMSIRAACSGKVTASRLVLATADKVIQGMFWAQVKTWVLAAAVALVVSVPCLKAVQHFQLVHETDNPPIISREELPGSGLNMTREQPTQLEDNDGHHLDDLQRWDRRQSLPMNVTPTRLEIQLSNAEIGRRFSQLLNKTVWQLSEGTASTRLTFEFIGTRSATASIDLIATITEEDGGVFWTVLRQEGQATMTWSTLSLKHNRLTELPAVAPIPIGTTLQATPGQHTFELVVSSSEIMSLVDGKLLCRINHNRAAKTANFQISSSSVGPSLNDSMVRVEDVTIGRSRRSDHAARIDNF